MKLKQIMKHIPVYNEIELRKNFELIAKVPDINICKDRDRTWEQYENLTVGTIRALDENVMLISVYER